MAIPNKQTAIEWKDGNTPSTGTLALGSNFKTEYERLIENDEHLDSVKLDKAGGNITGDLTIDGNLTINGEMTQINATELVVEDKIVTLNAGEPGPGVTGTGLSGIEIDRGDSQDKAKIVYNETDHKLRFGIGENLDEIVTRESGLLTPIGVIIPYMTGYFMSNQNDSFTQVALSLPDNWKMCDGSECLDEDSPIFNTAGRYLPNLTDDRFLMGASDCGTIGGQNHVILSEANLPAHIHEHSHTTPTHSHSVSISGTTGNEGSHTHYYSGNSTTVSNGSHSHSYTDYFSSENSNISSSIVESNIGDGGDGISLRTRSNYTNSLGSHTHSFYWSGTTNAGSSHSHSFSASTTSGTAAPSTDNTTFSDMSGVFQAAAIENRPQYLSCKFIMRIK